MGHVGGRRFSVGELHVASKTSSANSAYLLILTDILIKYYRVIFVLWVFGSKRIIFAWRYMKYGEAA